MDRSFVRSLSAFTLKGLKRLQHEGCKSVALVGGLVFWWSGDSAGRRALWQVAVVCAIHASFDPCSGATQGQLAPGLPRAWDDERRHHATDSGA